MELELEAAAGGGGSTVVSLSGDAPAADLGRGNLGHGGKNGDRTISRRHVSLRLLDGGGEPGVAFEVVGRNPVVVRRSSNGGDASISCVFRRDETGELRSGDALSLSLKAPLFWAVRRKDGDGEVEASVLDAVARRERRTRERKERDRLAAEEAMEVTIEEEEKGEAGSEVEGLEIDLASIDPVKEFGFLSMGHEFDSYPKGRIRPPKDWNWFLEEIKRSSDDEDDEVSNGRGRSKSRGGNKKKKNGEGEDEDWTDESEDEKESLSRGPSVKRTKYVTRSKDPKKPRKENSKAKSGNNRNEDEDVEEQEDEEDETLGGFIVNEEDEAMDELSEEEEEEDFDDEDDDD
ncbi:hypothetical protein EJB05_41306 [Eragrostis curvula]|uniref:FHA domain-containing protein n=1 Tax=Eragrostis curvula TaxID=38414 RepID=A0A5J9TAF3_9POAL|nr:hypothetical protein EJB05_41306 [Eragrostis curvula]